MIELKTNSDSYQGCTQENLTELREEIHTLKKLFNKYSDDESSAKEALDRAVKEGNELLSQIESQNRDKATSERK